MRSGQSQSPDIFRVPPTHLFPNKFLNLFVLSLVANAKRATTPISPSSLPLLLCVIDQTAAAKKKKSTKKTTKKTGTKKSTKKSTKKTSKKK